MAVPELWSTNRRSKQLREETSGCVKGGKGTETARSAGGQQCQGSDGAPTPDCRLPQLEDPSVRFLADTSCNLQDTNQVKYEAPVVNLL